MVIDLIKNILEGNAIFHSENRIECLLMFVIIAHVVVSCHLDTGIAINSRLFFGQKTGQ